MKRLSILCLLMLFCSVGNSQNLSMSELLSLLNKDIVEVEEYLDVKEGWGFVKAKKIPMETIGNFTDTLIHVKYKFCKEKWSEKADMILHCLHSSVSNSISIMTGDKPQYTIYLNTIKEYDSKLLYTNVDDYGNLVKTYQDKTHTYIISTIGGDEGVVYSISIQLNEYY